jgi:hypothetical protein
MAARDQPARPIQTDTPRDNAALRPEARHFRVIELPTTLCHD